MSVSVNSESAVVTNGSPISFKEVAGPLAFGALLFAMTTGGLFKDFYAVLGGYADQRFILVAGISVLVVIACFWARPRVSLSVTGLVIFAIAAVSSTYLYSHGVCYSYVEVSLYVGFLVGVGGLSLLIQRRPERFLPAALRMLLVCVIAYALTTPAVYLFAVTDGVSRLDQFLPWGFVNIRYWSHAASWLLLLMPLAVLVDPLKEHRLWRLFVAIAVGIWWWLLLLSSSRGSLLSILIASVLVVAVFGRSALPWLRVLGAQLCFGILAWLLLSWLIPALLIESPAMRSIGTDTSGRMPLWSEAWAMSLQNFPFGMGGQSWLTHEVLTSTYENSRKFGHPHNMYLMWAAEYGWLAVVGLGLIGLSTVARFMERRKEIARGEMPREGILTLIALSASVTTALIHAGASAVFIAPASMLIGLVVLGLFWSVLNLPAHSEGSSYRTPLRVSSWRWVAALVVGICLLVWNVQVVQYYQAMRADESWYSEHVGGGFQPRFWVHGNFPRHPDDMRSD